MRKNLAPANADRMKLNLRLGQRLGALFGGKKDREELLGEIEELLIGSDFGFEFTSDILESLRKDHVSLEKEDLIRRIKDIVKSRMSRAKPASRRYQLRARSYPAWEFSGRPQRSLTAPAAGGNRR